MRLLEYEGKAMLARHGIAIPRGWLLPALPDRLTAGLVVKAQTLGGGRAGRGGIVRVRGSAKARVAARRMGKRLADGEPIHGVLVEEALPVAIELYAAALVDRDRGGIQLLIGAGGGVGVEGRAAQIDPIAVDPLGGPDPRALLTTARRFGLSERAGVRLVSVLAALHETLVSEDAELVEINPLAVTPGEELVAADARIVLDDDALGRHPERRLWSAEVEGTPFERAASRLGVIGIEMAGDLCFFSNGAGLTMGTLDQLAAGGGRVAAMIELHGAVAFGAERIAEVVELLAEQHPRALLVNVFYHFRSTAVIADGVAQALDRRRARGGPPLPVVARLRGMHAEEAAERLRERGVIVASGFEAACRAVLAAGG